MKKIFTTIGLLASTVAIANNDTLTAELKNMDTLVFDSFNRCADAQQLKLHESFFASDVEFYHDNGGVTWDRAAMLNNTKNHACGKYTRELITQTFAAYPINGFGAITECIHKFCNVETKTCDGKAKFLMIWQNTNNHWQVTRVISYGHLPND